MATADNFRDVMRSQPFKPFEFRLADGKVYVVSHPDYLMVAPGPRARTVIYFEPDGERMHTIDLGLVSEIVTTVATEAK